MPDPNSRHPAGHRELLQQFAVADRDNDGRIDFGEFKLLLDGLEAAGCYILDDDFLIGWRWFLAALPAVDGAPGADGGVGFGRHVRAKIVCPRGKPNRSLRSRGRGGSGRAAARQQPRK